MAKTYTIKQGDTLSNIAKQFGTSASKLAKENQIADPNIIKAGATIKIPQPVVGQILKTALSPVLTGGFTDLFPDQKSPVLQNQNIEMSSVPENVPTVPNTREEIQTPEIQEMTEEDFNKLFSEYNQPETETTKATEDPLVARQTQLQNEITSLEEEMSRRTAVRNEELDVAGVFADMRKLNELRSELSKAQDRSIEIPLEKRQELRGRGATITEFEQATTPELEKAALSELIASRKVESLTDIVNTSIAIIDQQLKGINDQKDFIYKQKQQELENVQKIYGDIMTEEQKAKAEAVKQQNAIELENIKFKNDLMKSASIEALKANPEKANEIFSAVQSGDISKVYQVSGKNTVNIDETVNLVNIVERMLNNEKGLSGSAGAKVWFGGTAFTPNANKFRTDAKTLASKATLDYYTRLKANGAVFGTMTESEWNLLSNASDSSSLGIDPETGKSTLSDEDLKQRLEEYSNAQMKIATAVAMEKLGIDPSILKDKDYLDIRENYYKRYIPKAYEQTSQQVDYTQQDTGATDFIQKEEGFSPTAYQDQAGVWTIGYGTTKINGVPVKQGDTVSEEQARQIALEQAVNDYSTFADKLGDVELTPNQFTALNSFEYNLGSGVWNQPTGQQILQAIANKDFQTASTLMQKFVNVKNPQTGKLEPNKGLISRRQREGQLLFS